MARKYVGTAEAAKIIELWTEYAPKIRGVHKNLHIYLEMAKKLKEEHNVQLTAVELRNRINTYTKKFREEIRKMGKSGGVPSKWEHFEKVQQIFCASRSALTGDAEESAVFDAASTSNESNSQSLTSGSMLSDALAEAPPKTIKRERNDDSVSEEYFQEAMETDEKIKKDVSRKYVGTAEAAKIIELWTEYAPKIRGVHNNLHIYLEMAKKLKEEHNVQLTAVELRNRINSYTKKFRKENLKISKSGGAPSKWEHFKTVQNILGASRSPLTDDAEESAIFDVALKSNESNPQSLTSGSMLSEALAEAPPKTIKTERNDDSVFEEYFQEAMETDEKIKKDVARKYVGTAEAAKIIELWTEYAPKIRGVHNNLHIYLEMAKKLKEEHNVQLTAVELRNRINSYTKKFREENRKMDKSGGTPSKWEHFEKMEQTFGASRSASIDDAEESAVFDVASTSKESNWQTLASGSVLSDALGEAPPKTFKRVQNDDSVFEDFFQKAMETDEKIKKDVVRKYVGTAEAAKIIELWTKYAPKIRGVHKNLHIYLEMAKKLKEEYNVQLTAIELRNRINTYTKKFREENRKMDKSGGTPSKWEHFEKVQKIFGASRSALTDDAEESAVFDVASTSNESNSQSSTPGSLLSDPLAEAPPKAKKMKHKDDSVFEKYFQKAIETDEKIIKIMENTNEILLSTTNNLTTIIANLTEIMRTKK